jgi:acyl-coenzyme A thioesterase PaaI-like protein
LGDGYFGEDAGRKRERAKQVWPRTPLGRLLAINLAIGVALAVVLVGGLLMLNPGGLRDLILADRSPLVPIGLLLGGFIVTLGSTAMGTAIMAMGEWDEERPGGGLRVAKQETMRRKS